MYSISVYVSIFFSILYIQGNVSASLLRIVGGQEAAKEFGLFHASLQNLTGHHVCGGAIVSNQHIVTAAHCMYGADPRYVKIVVGTTNIDVGGIQYDVDTITLYNDFNFSLRLNDIAVLRANKPFDLRYIQIIQLNQNELSEGDIVILTGFGAEEPNGESSRQLHVLSLPVFNQETCRFAMRYSREVSEDMFCTFTRIGEGTCHGDSGGPLIRNNQLVGVVSWGIPCAVGFPDVHTRITPYIQWIQQEISRK